jgi:Fur family ferric uptake transcriptional regulator
MIQRNTKQRQVILEELKNLRNHPTASMIYDIVQKKLPKISLGTIYRNLDQLAQAGYIRKLEVSGAEARYDGILSDHYHIRCTECDRIDDLFDIDLQINRANEAALEGYQLEGFKIELKGLCPACRIKTGQIE